MRTKRCIACWLLVVYLLTAVGPAYASLTCRCTVMKARTETVCGCHHGHAHCHVSHGTAPAKSAWEAPCCNDRHSTDIELYTGGTDDRTDKTVLPVSSPLLPDDLTVAAPAPAFYERVTDRRAQFLCHGSVRCAGFRAPPARC